MLGSVYALTSQTFTDAVVQGKLSQFCSQSLIALVSVDVRSIDSDFVGIAFHFTDGNNLYICMLCIVFITKQLCCVSCS